MPILAAGALVLLAACGGSGDPGAVLTQADFAAKVRAAMQAKGSFRSVAVNIDAEGVTRFTTDVKLSGARADVSGTTSDDGEVSSVVRVGGELYARDKALSTDPAKPWVKFDPKGTTLNATLIQLLATRTETYELIGGAAYATSFSSAPAGESTVYSMTIDLPKATAAKALGDYISAGMVAELKLHEVPVRATVGKDMLLTKLEFELDGTKVVADFGNYGAPVTIAVPGPAEIL